MAELLKLRQDDFVTVTISGEDLDRTPHDNIGAVADFASRKISAEAGNWTTWATSASARSSLASRSLNKARCWRNCSCSDVIMIRSFPDLRSHASFWVFIKSASERRELKRNSSVPFPARQWERVLDFMSLAVPLFAFASR